MSIAMTGQGSNTNGTIGLPTSMPYDFGALFATVYRQKLRLAAWILFCLACASGYLYVTPPEYTASTQIVLETPKRQRLALDVDGDPIPMDSAQADSRIQIIKSERLLRFVFNTLNLQTSFPTEPSSLPDRLLSLVRAPTTSPQGSQDTRAFLDFMDKVSARRIGLSYAIEISYRSNSPVEAARIANAITDGYIRDLVLAAPSDREVLQRSISDVERDGRLLLEGMKAGIIPPGPIAGIDTKVIGAAIVPLSKSAPHGSLTLAFAFVIGLTSGLAALLTFHNRDRVIRSERAAVGLLGTRLLATVTEQPVGRLAEPLRSSVELEKLASFLVAGSTNVVRVGILSWQRNEATHALASRLANLLVEGAPTTLLQILPGLGSETNLPAELEEEQDAAARSKVRNVTRTQQTDRGLRTLVAGLTRDGQGWLSSKSRRTSIFAKLQQDHLVLDLPALRYSRIIPCIGSMMAGVLLVIEQGRSTSIEVSAALDALRLARMEFLGAVLWVPSADKKDRRAFSRRMIEVLPDIFRLARPGLRIGTHPLDSERRG